MSKYRLSNYHEGWDEDYDNWGPGDTVVFEEDFRKQDATIYTIDHMTRGEWVAWGGYVYFVPGGEVKPGAMTKATSLVRIKKAEPKLS